MNDYLGMSDCVELEEYAIKNIDENCSFKAINSRGEIIGVAMNGIINKPVSKKKIMFNQIFIENDDLHFSFDIQKNTKYTICNFRDSF